MFLSAQHDSMLNRKRPCHDYRRFSVTALGSVPAYLSRDLSSVLPWFGPSLCWRSCSTCDVSFGSSRLLSRLCHPPFPLFFWLRSRRFLSFSRLRSGQSLLFSCQRF